MLGWLREEEEEVKLQGKIEETKDHKMKREANHGLATEKRERCEVQEASNIRGESGGKEKENQPWCG